MDQTILLSEIKKEARKIESIFMGEEKMFSTFLFKIFIFLTIKNGGYTLNEVHSPDFHSVEITKNGETESIILFSVDGDESDEKIINEFKKFLKNEGIEGDIDILDIVNML